MGNSAQFDPTMAAGMLAQPLDAGNANPGAMAQMAAQQAMAANPGGSAPGPLPAGADFNNAANLPTAPSLAGAASPVTSPVVTGNPAASGHPGVLKNMLFNLVYGMGEALRQKAGMPTDAQVKQQQFENQQKQQQMQLQVAEGARQAATYAANAQVHNPASTLKALGYDIPDGVDLSMPAGAANELVKQAVLGIPNMESKDAKETPQQTFERMLKEGQQLGLQGNDLVNYINKHPITAEKTPPNLNEAQLAMNAASDDPRISGPAKQALAYLAQAQKSSKVQVNLGVSPNVDPTGTLSNPNEETLAKMRASNQLTDAQLKQIYPGQKNSAAMGRVMLRAGVLSAGGNLNTALSNSAQQNMVTAKSAMDNVNQLMKMIEDNHLQNNSSQLDPQKWLDVMKYKSGMPGSSAYSQSFAGFSLGAIKEAAAIMKGSSRAWAGLSKALEHTPNIFYTPAGNYQRLKEIKTALQQTIDETQNFGSKSGQPQASQTGKGMEIWGRDSTGKLVRQSQPQQVQ